jgi:hypothetical protein
MDGQKRMEPKRETKQDTKRRLIRVHAYPGPVFLAAAKQVSEALYRDLGRFNRIAR